MNVLYLGQHSMRTYTEPIEYVLAKDGALQRQLARIAVLPKTWRWRLILPTSRHPLPSEYFALLDEGFDIAVIWLPVAPNVMRQRFEPPQYDRVALEVRDFEPDLMLCEMPEHVATIRGLQNYDVWPEFPIISLILHIELFKETEPVQSYFLRQLEGFSHSDAVVFPLPGIKDEWMKHAHFLVKEDAWDLLNRPTFTWKGMFSPKTLGANVKPSSKPEPAVLTFISRLTDSPRTKAPLFIEAAKLIRKHDHDPWRIFVGDPTDLRLIPEQVFLAIGNTRESYKEALAASHVVPILYPQNKIASIGFCEAVWKGAVVIHVVDPNEENDLDKVGMPIEPGFDEHDLVKRIYYAWEEGRAGIHDGDWERIYELRSTDVEAEHMRVVMESVCS